MSFTKSTGNMYPWVTHCHSFLRGECPHKCSYCYARDPVRGHPSRQIGPLAMDWTDLEAVRYPAGSTVFVEHKNDLWADSVPDDWIAAALRVSAMRHHVGKVRSVFQSKNPARFNHWLGGFGPDDIVGTTIETNRDIPAEISLAPQPKARASGLAWIPKKHLRFVTIEPVMAFDVDAFTQMLVELQPTWINIGADSKRKNLPEPDAASIRSLLLNLSLTGIEVRVKGNLNRILEKGGAA